eukprot:g2901.t1
MSTSVPQPGDGGWMSGKAGIRVALTPEGRDPAEMLRVHYGLAKVANEDRKTNIVALRKYYEKPWRRRLRVQEERERKAMYRRLDSNLSSILERVNMSHGHEKEKKF